MAQQVDDKAIRLCCDLHHSFVGWCSTVCKTSWTKDIKAINADEIVRIIEKVFTQLAEDYLLSQQEAENIIDSLKKELTGSTLKDMFSSSDRQAFARKLLVKHIEPELAKRKHIVMPTDEELHKSLKQVLEDIADNMDNEPCYV